MNLAVAACAWLLGSGTAAAGNPESANRLTAKEKQGGYRLLFDGRTILGWHGYRTPTIPAGWKVIDGTLVGGKQAGDLVSVEKYSDFEFSFDFKIGKGGNSGVIYRASETEDRSYKSGPEYQIIDDDTAGITPEQTTASNYALDAPRIRVARPAGEWNQGRIVVRDNHVEHWLNGTRVVKYQLGSPAWQAKVRKSKFSDWPGFGTEPSGHICLQEHGSPVAFRSLKIRDLGQR